MKKSKRGNKWPEFKRHLKPLPADLLQDDAPYIFMDVDHLEAERQVIEDALPNPPGFHRTNLSSKQAMNLAFVVSKLARFGEPPSVDALRERLVRLQPEQSAGLRYRLTVIETTLRSACEIWGRDYDSSRTFVVNHRWDRRWEGLLCGGIYLAYVGFLLIDEPPLD